jgi:PII-like signaling protein
VKTRPVTVVRVYVREGEHVLKKLVHFLHEEQKIAGLTVMRGVIGVGNSGQLHPSSLLDLSLDLPLVVEFFDEPERAEQAVEQLLKRFNLDHVISMPAVGHAVDK